MVEPKISCGKAAPFIWLVDCPETHITCPLWECSVCPHLKHLHVVPNRAHVECEVIGDKIEQSRLGKFVKEYEDPKEAWTRWTWCRRPWDPWV
jgi:hypothetical protein